jgi:16S rRNA (guanine966-N2)-methyltransferase
MHITSGTFKNRHILTALKNAKQPDYRPTAARTRLALFNILRSASYLPDNYLNDAVVLDLYCGSGAFGFEAISNGASHVVFVDESNDQINLSKENAKLLKIEDSCSFIRARCNDLPAATTPCKIIYLDPPYNKNFVQETLNSLKVKGWIAERNLIIIEHDKFEKFKVEAPYEFIETRNYGKTHITFLTYRL